MKYSCKLHRFFPPKNLVYIWLNDRLHLKKQTFFPPKDLVFLRYYISLFTSTAILPPKNFLFFDAISDSFQRASIFPPKDLVFNGISGSLQKRVSLLPFFFSKHISISRLRTVSQFYSVCLQFHSAPKVQVVKLLLWHFITDNKFSRIPSCKAKKNQH